MASSNIASSTSVLHKPSPRSWQPGDPIRFGSTSSTSSVASSTTTMQQRTLSPWTAKSAWQPGMAVDIHPPKVTVRAPINKRDTKNSSQSSLESYWVPSKSKKRDKKATPPKQKPNVAPRSPIYIEDSFDSGHATVGDKSASSTSTANATLGDKAGYDSSIELIQPNGSPLSQALRHFALGQQHLKEALAQRNAEEQRCQPSTSHESSSPLPDITSIFEKPRSPLRAAPLSHKQPSVPKAGPSARKMHTSSRARAVALDWDDPVVAGHASDSSDLPDWPPKKPDRSAPAPNAEKGKGTAPARQPLGAVRLTSAPQTKPAVKPASKAPSTKLLKELKAEGQRAKMATAEERAFAKAAETDRLKSKYPQFNYDAFPGIPPKVWYFKGKHAEYVSCDTRSRPEVKTLEEVAGELKGPLGFDLEWSTKASWNSDFSSKNAQARTGLLQLGDQRNIILYQLLGSKSIPECLLRIIEDRDVIKLGVQIKGDGSKLDRDFGTETKPVAVKACLELSDLAKQVGKQQYAKTNYMISLQRLVADWLERYLEKGDDRTSNWDTPLSSSQRKYAANDVYCAVRLFQRLMGYAQELKDEPVNLAACIYDLHHKQTDTGEWRSMGWKARDVVKRPPVSGGSEIDRKQWDQASSLGPRVLEAWEHWYLNDKDVDDIAKDMSVKSATVVNYIVSALAGDSALPFQHGRLRAATKGVYLRKEQTVILAQILSRPAAEEGHAEEEEE